MQKTRFDDQRCDIKLSNDEPIDNNNLSDPRRCFASLFYLINR